MAADDEPTPEPAQQRTPFDPLAYIQSSRRRERKDLRRFSAISLSAVRLARQASPRLFLVNAGLQLVTALVLAGQVLLGKLALEAIFEQADGGGKLEVALPPLLGLVAVTAVGSLAMSVQQQLQRLLGERVQQLTWSKIISVTASVPLETFESPDFFDELQRVKANALLRPLTLAQGLVQLVGGALGILGLSIALLLIEPVLLPILLAGGLPLWLLSRRTGKIEFDFRVGQTPLLRMREYLTELLSGRDEAKEIRAFGLGPVIFGRWKRNYREYLDDYRAHVISRVKLAVLGALVMIIVTGVSLGLLVWFVFEDRIPLASAGAALIAIRLLGGRIQQLFVGIGELFECGLFLRDFDRFLDRATGDPLLPARRVPDIPPFQELKVEDVGFSYPGSDHPVLEDISLTLRAGEVIALVGENGSGKTTLAKLLCHVFHPTSGRILWDGADSRELDQEGLRQNVSVIFQDFVRYQLTARENISFGRGDADDPEGISEVARRTGADSFLRRLPDGYETSLGKEYQGGFDLSLGQWQRIALARAFFRDASFLVLDEPTASLDARSEHELFEQVRQLAAGRCLLLISHRFSTVKEADCIYVLHEGRLIEQGNHDELMAIGGRYAELFDLQARAYR